MTPILCVGCRRPIAGEASEYRGEPYHGECRIKAKRQDRRMVVPDGGRLEGDH